MADLAPTIFFGHGSPLTTLTQNPYTRGWAAVGRAIPKPRAILCVSAHYYVPSTEIIVSTSPMTIHDFGGFPQELHDIQYPAPGSPELARRVAKLLAPLPVELTDRWGYDHGTWSVLRHVYPKADVPVVAISVDLRRPADYHFDIGRRLAELREDGVMIVGSGNLVHNLMRFVRNQPTFAPYDWATRFDQRAKELMQGRDFESLIRYDRLGREAELSVPTPDHYLPALYVLGASEAQDKLSFPVEGIDGGSMSMRVVQFG